MERTLVCIGGTGQMVLHYYLQAYLLGLVDKPFQAIVIDTDDIIQSLQLLSGFFEKLRHGPQSNQGVGVEIPSIRTIRIQPQSGESVFSVLAGRDRNDWDGLHPCEAFFDRDSLAQSVTQGLFARPALSAVMSRSLLAQLKPSANSTVVVVGSVIGGTGGGLIAPVIDQIRSLTRLQAIDGVRIRGVFFGEYFSPTPGKIAGGSARFQSNQLMVLQALKEANIEELHSYLLVGGPDAVSRTRDPEAEKAGKSLPWPSRDSEPIWRGLTAAEFLFSETAQQAEIDFERKEIGEFDPPLSLEEATERLRQALSAVEALTERRPLPLIAEDPLARRIWGRSLTDLLASYWQVASDCGGSVSPSLLSDLQDAVTSAWTGGPRPMGLQHVFPRVLGLRSARPGAFRRVPWPRFDSSSRDHQLYISPQDVLERAAATILFWTLRRGR